MDNDKEIVNRVAASSLVTFDLEDYYVPGDRVVIDIADQLIDGFLLREKNFRDYIKSNDWSKYDGKFVAVTCSADAIIPTWAFMLLTSALKDHAREIAFGNLDDLEFKIFLAQLRLVDWEKFNNAKVVVKGCSKVNVPVSVYVEATRLLLPYASSIMYGEPCSTVPVFKRTKAAV